MDSTEGMRVFTRVVRAGSLSAAGRSLGISSASVSRKISALEQATGARLLDRTSRKIALTQLGELYFEKACLILDHIELFSVDGVPLPMVGYQRAPCTSVWNSENPLSQFVAVVPVAFEPSDCTEHLELASPMHVEFRALRSSFF